MESSNKSPIPDQFHFYYTKRKILFFMLKGLVVIAFFAFIYLADRPNWKLETLLRDISRDRGWVLGFWAPYMAILLWWFFYRPLQQLSKLSTPAVTMSRDGIALKGGVPIPWSVIKRVQFVSSYGVSLLSMIRITTSTAFWPRTIPFDTIGISCEESNKQYRIYSRLAS